MYIGGHENHNFTLLPHDLPVHRGFQGCVFDLAHKTNLGQLLPMPRYFKWRFPIYIKVPNFMFCQYNTKNFHTKYHEELGTQHLRNIWPSWYPSTCVLTFLITFKLFKFWHSSGPLRSWYLWHPRNFERDIPEEYPSSQKSMKLAKWGKKRTKRVKKQAKYAKKQAKGPKKWAKWLLDDFT